MKGRRLFKTSESSSNDLLALRSRHVWESGTKFDPENPMFSFFPFKWYSTKNFEICGLRLGISKMGSINLMLLEAYTFMGRKNVKVRSARIKNLGRLYSVSRI